MIPVPVMEPTLPPADQSLPDSDQENIPPRMVTPPPLNVLVPVSEEEILVKECCQRTLAVRNQRAIRGRGAITKPFHPSGRKQLALVSKIVAVLQDSCEQRRRVRWLQRGLGGLETMGPVTVTDLPRYHSLVEDFGRLADRWMAAGQLRGPANVGGGYLLDLQIPLSGEEGDVLLGEIARDNEGEMDL